MNTASSPTEEKKPRIYRIVDQETQAKAVNDSRWKTQREVAEKYGVPRSTAQHWIDRKKGLQETMEPSWVEFFESPAGYAWLRRLIGAVFVVFHQNGNSGIPDLHEFFQMIFVDKFVATSESALYKISKELDKQAIIFGDEEKQRLAQNMPHKTIPGALDENFIMDEMTLILMDPISGMILAEQIEQKRDAETWHRVTQAALKGLNVTMHQMVGDEASGLTKLATCTLQILKGPDLFHVQQEITRGLTGHLARAVQQAKQKQEDLRKEKSEMLAKFSGHLKQAGEVDELSRRGVNAGKRVIEIEEEEKANQKKIEELESRYETAQEARRGITQAYHPFSLDTGEKQTPKIVKEKIEKCHTILENVAKEAECTDKQMKKLEKARGSLESMIAVLTFFFAFLAMRTKSMGLDESSAKAFEMLVSIQYFRLCLQRTKKKLDKEKIKATLGRLEEELGKNPLWGQIAEAVRTEWWSEALRCAQVFQRSSSCVEGRNGQLSLKFHAFRHLNGHTLKVLTVLHNFFIKRKDGTTAAERFFGQKPRDYFEWILDKLELARPRSNHKRQTKKTSEKQVA